MAEKRVANAQVGGDRSTKIAGQQDRAEDRGGRKHIDDQTCEFEEAEGKAGGIADDVKAGVDNTLVMNYTSISGIINKKIYS